MRRLRNQRPPAVRAEDDVKPRADHVQWTLNLEALTPIYKGGAGQEGVSEGRPFRGSSIRGQLRFWWRATQNTKDLDLLREREQKLFGTVFGDGDTEGEKRARASQLRVRVHGQRSVLVDVLKYVPSKGRGGRGRKGASRDQNDPLNYVLWVEREEHDRTFHEHGASCTLQVEAPTEYRGEVARALQAWVLVGGVGSRSRRGAGSLHCTRGEDSKGQELIPAIAGPEDYLRRLLDLAPEDAAPRDWPSLAGVRVLWGPGNSDAVEAWREAAGAMKRVRSGSKDAKKVPRRLGTDWKSISGYQSGFSSRNAALGLPIGYNQHEWTVNVDEKNEGNRFPSPVWMRVVPVGADRASRKYHPVMVVLTAPHPQELLQAKKKKGPRNTAVFDPARLDVFVDAIEALAEWSRLGGDNQEVSS